MVMALTTMVMDSSIVSIATVRIVLPAKIFTLGATNSARFRHPALQSSR